MNTQTQPSDSPRRWDKKSRLALAKGMLLVLTLGAVAWSFQAMGLEDALHMDDQWVEVHLKGNHWGWLVFLGFAALYTGLGLPRQFAAIVGGYAFGVVVGGLLALAATLIGCVFAFFYARFLGRDLVIRKFGSRLEKINRVLEKNPMSMTLIIRFLPFGSNIVTNLVAGVSSIPVLWFLLGSLVGYLPQTFIFALLGKGVLEDPLWTTLLSAALLAISIFIGIALYRKYKLQDVLSDD